MSSVAMAPASATATAGGGSGERWHALDAVRAGALLLGVVLHASMSFVPGQQIWAVHDQESPSLGVVFFVSHVFRMPLFFLMAGFFGRMALERRGLRGFVRDRLKRIALPLAAFWPLSFATLTALFIWGFVRQHGLEAAKAAPPPPAGSLVDTFPLTHLWFLYVLLGLYAAGLLVRAVVVTLDRRGWLRTGLDRLLRTLVTTLLAPLVLAAPTALALYLRPDWLAFFGVPTPDRGLVPNVPALAAYGTAFGFGWLLHRQPDLLRVWQRHWRAYLVAAVGLTAAYLWTTGLRVVLDPAAQPATQDPTSRLALALGYPLATWTWSLGLIGLAMRHLSARRPAIRYLADASYWIYLIHLPIVVALQVVLLPLSLPALVKFALVILLGFPIMPLSYHLAVRSTFIGGVLNGRRYPRRARALAADGALAPSAS